MYDDYYGDDGHLDPSLDDERLAFVARLFRALSDPLRLKIYEVAWGPRKHGITIGEIAERTGMKQSLVSFHVKKLVEVELLVPDSPDNRRGGYRGHGTSFADISRWQRSLANRVPPFPPGH
jgi:DNA-binding transcriptional ArsR family regulator